MSWLSDNYGSMAGVDDPDARPGLSFTGQDMYDMYGPDGPDEDDIEVLNLVMEKDMRERAKRALAENARLREENENLRAEIERLTEEKVAARWPEDYLTAEADEDYRRHLEDQAYQCGAFPEDEVI